MPRSTTSKQSAEELARSARAGSAACFTELVARFEGSLYAFLLLRSASPQMAEELTQDTFVRAWSKLDLYDASYRFSTWLFTLARRLLATRRREGRIDQGGGELLAGVGSPIDPPRILTDGEERENLWRVAARVLPLEQHEALWLRYAEELPIPEVARVLERPEATVRVQLFRARERLSHHLTPIHASSARRAVGGRA